VFASGSIHCSILYTIRLIHQAQFKSTTRHDEGRGVLLIKRIKKLKSYIYISKSSVNIVEKSFFIHIYDDQLTPDCQKYSIHHPYVIHQIGTIILISKRTFPYIVIYKLQYFCEKITRIFIGKITGASGVKPCMNYAGCIMNI